MKEKIRKQDTFRLIVQAISFALHNGYVMGWVSGKIYDGNNKKFCVPGLNCYSCPGAVGSCPIGSLQAVLDSGTYKFSLYMLAFFGMVGIFCGRVVCGWLCPFGWIQDLMHKIPLFQKEKNLPGHKYLKYLKYVILVLFVILLPMLVLSSGAGSPWFCEWICPSGTLLGGIPQVIAHENLREAIGPRFFFKLAVLLVILTGSVKFSRPFCKYLCPLGAIYGFCNPLSTYRLKVNENSCISCGACQKACPMDLKTWQDPNSMECIRCGRCMAACPTSSITSTWKQLLAGQTCIGGLNGNKTKGTVPETVQETTQETVQETTQETIQEAIPETVQETTQETIPETVQETGNDPEKLQLWKKILTLVITLPIILLGSFLAGFRGYGYLVSGFVNSVEDMMPHMTNCVTQLMCYGIMLGLAVLIVKSFWKKEPDARIRDLSWLLLIWTLILRIGVSVPTFIFSIYGQSGSLAVVPLGIVDYFVYYRYSMGATLGIALLVWLINRKWTRKKAETAPQAPEAEQEPASEAEPEAEQEPEPAGSQKAD